MAKAQTAAQRRRALKARAKAIAQRDLQDRLLADDPFHGLGDFEPRDTNLTAIARAIVQFENLKLKKPAPPKPTPAAKKSTRKKAAPKPKKGKRVARAQEVCIRSPFTRETQWIPLVPSVSELLAEGWEIVDGDLPVAQALEMLGVEVDGG